MRYKITSPKSIHTSVLLPASKSISNRALILNALSLSNKFIENLSNCEDTQMIVDVFNSNSNVFDVKASGTAMRFLTAFLAGMEGEWIIQGSQRMHERPIHPLVDTLTALGAQIEYLQKEGFPPLKINGRKLRGGEVYLSGNISSQFTSALLMVAPTMENGLTIHLEKEIVSEPYIHLTLKMMEQYGVSSKWKENDIVVKPQLYKPASITVEADWSAASYWYEIAALMPDAEIELIGLQRDSWQGDANLVNLFTDLGVRTRYTANGVVLKKTKKTTKKFFHDFIKEPDLVQTFVATCCFQNIPFLFSGLNNLKIKETDRIEAMRIEFNKLGYCLQEIEPGILEWDKIRTAAMSHPVIQTHNDHRMAMSFMPAAIPLGSITIEDPHVVLKSYPNFWEDIQNAGFSIETTH